MRRAQTFAWSALTAAWVLASPGLSRAGPDASPAAPADWPCPGCVVHVPPHLPEGPRPLLVALHGDGGAVLPLVHALQASCDEAGVILLAPRCPREAGCTAASYWRWLQDARHDEHWLGRLVDAVRGRWAIDPARVYAAGYSGGATYLGWYVPTHPLQFAAVAHIAGGAPLARTCPACKVPVMFVLGAADPMLVPYTEPLRAFYDACGGHEVVWQTLRGVTHEGILATLQAGRAKDVLGWLLAHPAACAAPPADAGVAAAPAPDAGFDAGTAEDGQTLTRTARAPDADAGAEPAPLPSRVPPARGCACGLAAIQEDRTGSALLLVLVATVHRRRARHRHPREDRALRPGCR